MKFAEAYRIAMSESEEFRRADSVVRKGLEEVKHTPCYLFRIGDEVFYYGFDGVDLIAGRHTPRRAAVLISRGEAGMTIRD